MLEVMTDDRIVRRFEQIRSALFEELAYIEELSPYCWERLSQIVPECSSSDLRSSAIQCAHTAASYVARNVLNVLTGFPWKLCCGDIHRNLEELAKSAVEHSEPTTVKIKSLLAWLQQGGHC